MSETVKRDRTPRSTRVYVGLFIFCFVSGLVFVNQQVRQERRDAEQVLRQAGLRFVHLVSLYPLTDMKPERRDSLLRTLSEYRADAGLLYLYIHDAAGKPIVALDYAETATRIPPEIQAHALYAMGQISQRFKDVNTGQTVYEFAIPLLQDGQRQGSLRVGMSPVPVQLFSLRNINYLATIAFLMLAAAGVGHFLTSLAVRRLRNLHPDSLEGLAGEQGTEPRGNRPRREFVQSLEDLDASIDALKRRVGDLVMTNTELVSKLGVVAFEKKQVYSVLDSMNLGIIVVDGDEHILRVNRYILSLLGRELRDVLDCRLRDVVDKPEVLSLIESGENIDGSQSVESAEVTFDERAPGKTFRVTCAPLQNGSPGVLGRIVTFENITHEKLAAANKQNFITNLAHELLNPLTIIKTHNEMLMDEEIEDANTRREFCNIINDEIERLNQLVQNFLDMSRIEMGGLKLNKALFKTDWLVRDCLPVIEASARDKQISLVKKLPDNFPSMMADKELLKVAVVNILGNAVKYTPERGTVTFSMVEKDEALVIEVSDTGYGISAADLPHIFDKHFRSNDPNVASQLGNGMGLAITYEIIHLHGGEIDVDSHVGKGSRFTVRIPKEEYFLAK